MLSALVRPASRLRLGRATSRLYSCPYATMAGPGAGWTHVPAAGNRPAYYVFDTPIERSQQDDRQYRLIQLENGLNATLVSDPNGDKAAASLDVAVGHLFDPDDMPGTAHFCEHMLFLGTEQFPRENEYSEYLAKNSGHSNAYTSTSNTNYYFNVGPPALSGALTRFSSFFHSPLFSSSGTARELNAVDSEHKKNHQADQWRIFQTNKHLSKDGHVWRKFGTGNSHSLTQAARDMKKKSPLAVQPKTRTDALQAENTTLSRAASPTPTLDDEADGGPVGRETRRRLVEWWSTEYCASRMRLAVVGKESLDELTEMTVPLFAPIKNRGRDPLPMLTEHPFGPNESGTLVSLQTIMDFQILEISFPFEWQPPYWRHHPASFLSHFVGHEGPGSLHSYLKNKGWISALSAGQQNLARGFAMFKVTIHLTEAGFENYRSVISATFKYLSLLRSSKLESWRQTEQALITNTRFRFLEKGKPDQYAIWLTSHMGWPLPPERLISGPQQTEEWDTEGKAETDMRRMLDSLRASEGRAFLMAKPEKHEHIRGQQTWETEPIYGTQYRVERFDDALMKEAEAPNDILELYLPHKNEFIPANLDVLKKDVSEPAKRPFLIRQTPLSSLWFKKDDQFWVPKAHAIMQIISPHANNTARKAVLTRLWTDLITDSLTEYAYDAELAGLNYSVSSDHRGIFVVVSGYNDKLHVLAQRVLERIKHLDVQADRLAIVVEQAKRSWRNFFLGKPYEMSNYFSHWLLAERQWRVDEKLEEIESITTQDVEAHIKQFLAETNSDILVVGNMTKEDAMTYSEVTEKTIGSRSVSPSAAPDAGLILAEGTNHTWVIPVPNPAEVNSAVTYYMHIGDATDARTRVITALLSQLLSEPAFNQLRTQETLGYIVSCGSTVLPRDTHTGLRIFLQSERKPAYCEERIESFLAGQRGRLESMPAKEFAEQKEGLKRKWLERLKNLREETNRYWKYIAAGHFDFHRRMHNAKLLDLITLEDVLEVYRSKIDPTSPSRAKVSVHLRAQKEKPKKASKDATDAFDAILRTANDQLSDEHSGWRADVGADGDAEPQANTVVEHWRKRLAHSEDVSPAQVDELVAAFEHLIDKYPSTFDNEGKLAHGTVLIEDPKAFKAKLEVAKEPRPLVEWGDLPTPKL